MGISKYCVLVPSSPFRHCTGNTLHWRNPPLKVIWRYKVLNQSSPASAAVNNAMVYGELSFPILSSQLWTFTSFLFWTQTRLIAFWPLSPQPLGLLFSPFCSPNDFLLLRVWCATLAKITICLCKLEVQELQLFTGPEGRCTFRKVRI